MFFNKTRNLRYHPGKYIFQIPYSTFNFLPDENGYIPIHQCSVEIKIGDESWKSSNTLCTVEIISESAKTVGTTNFIEQITTNIFLTIFPSIFYNFRRDMIIISQNIRWFEIYTKDSLKSLSHNGIKNEIELKWNQKDQKFSNPNFLPKQYNHDRKKTIEVLEGHLIEVELINSKLSSKTNEIIPYMVIKNINDSKILVVQIKEKISDYCFINENNLYHYFDLETISIIERKDVINIIYRIPPDLLVLVGDKVSSSISFKDSYLGIKHFKKGDKIKIFEGDQYEFKSMENTNIKNIVRSITKDAEKYIVGFLNGHGKAIFFGVSDKGIIEGVRILPSQRDLLQKKIINDVCEKINPQISRIYIDIYFHNISYENSYLKDIFVLEIAINGKFHKIYKTREGSVYHHKCGTNKKLSEVQQNELRRTKNITKLCN